VVEIFQIIDDHCRDIERGTPLKGMCLDLACLESSQNFLKALIKENSCCGCQKKIKTKF